MTRNKFLPQFLIAALVLVATLGSSTTVSNAVPLDCEQQCVWNPRVSCTTSCYNSEAGFTTTCGAYNSVCYNPPVCGNGVCEAKPYGSPSWVVGENHSNCPEDCIIYTSYPLIVESAIGDIHESTWNGPKGFAYFDAAGDEKTGNLPCSLGGQSGWQCGTQVWASNFQGPHEEKNHARTQWEWMANGWLETWASEYPFIYGKTTVDDPADFAKKWYKIMEDDDWGNPDDYVGKFEIDHTQCQKIFNIGSTSGWRGPYKGPGKDDVAYVRYKLYCYATYLDP